MRLTLLISISLGLTSACRSTNSSLDIVGGQLVRTGDPTALHTIALVETEGEFDEYCTAVLIAPDAALTAAHCFLEPKNHPMLFFGKQIPNARKDSDNRFVEISEVVIHPDFSQKKLDAFDTKIRHLKESDSIPFLDDGLDDLAIVLFRDPILEGFLPVKVTGDLPDGERSIAAGFGCLSTECDTFSGRLRKVELSFERVLGKSDMLVMNAGRGRGTCAGDSGAPGFLPGNTPSGLELLSIVSTGPESCEAGISIETRVAPYEPWIQKVLKDSH